MSASNYDLVIGSFSSGDYTIGQQDIGFLWDGTVITQFWRSSGTYTNGFNFYVLSPDEGAPDRIAMEIEFFVVDIYNGAGFIFEETTVVIVPEGTILPDSNMSFDGVKALYR